MASAAERDILLPRPPKGMASGAILAVAVHAGLVVALAAATNWRSREPELAAMAELWAAVPRNLTPSPAPAPPPEPAPAPAPAPAPEPPPPPPPPAPAPAPAPPPPAPAPAPDIALKAEKRRQTQAAQAEQRERERRQREQAAAEEKRLTQQREENLRRMMAQAGDTAPAAPNRGPASEGVASADYTARLVALIRSNIVFTGAVNAQAVAEVEVRAGPSGTILSRRLLKSSGQPDWDEAVLRAIDRTATLPRDENGRVPDELVIRFRPRE